MTITPGAAAGMVRRGAGTRAAVEISAGSSCLMKVLMTLLRGRNESARELLHLRPVGVLVVARHVGAPAVRGRDAPHQSPQEEAVVRVADRAGGEEQAAWPPSGTFGQRG